MPHTISYNSEENCIETKVWGNMTTEEVDGFISGLVWAVKEHDCFSILHDYREARLDMSVFDIYEIPKKASDAVAALGLDINKIKRALIVRNDSRNFDFLQTVMFNRGQPVKLFEDEAEAKKWLFEK